MAYLRVKNVMFHIQKHTKKRDTKNTSNTTKEIRLIHSAAMLINVLGSYAKDKEFSFHLRGLLGTKQICLCTDS